MNNTEDLNEKWQINWVKSKNGKKDTWIKWDKWIIRMKLKK